MTNREIALEIFKGRLDIKTEGLEKAEVELSNKMYTCIKVPDTFKGFVILQGEHKQFLQDKDIFVLLNKDYDYANNDIREIIVSVNNVLLNISLSMSIASLYENNGMLIMEINKFNDELIRAIYDRNYTEEVYPKLIPSITFKNSMYNIDIKLQMNIYEDPIVVDNYYSEDKELAIKSYSERIDVYNKNLDGLKVLYSGENCIHCSLGTVSIVQYLRSNLICSTINVKSNEKIDIIETIISPYELLKNEHNVSIEGEYIFYNGILFDNKFVKIDKELKYHYLIEDILNDIASIRNLISKEDPNEKPIIIQEKELLQAKYNKLSEVGEKDYYNDTIIHYFGKVCNTRGLYKYIEELISEIDSYIEETSDLDSDSHCGICGKQVHESDLVTLAVDGNDDYYQFDTCSDCSEKYSSDTYTAEDILKIIKDRKDN